MLGQLPQWLNQLDPTTQRVVLISAAAVALLIVLTVLSRIRGRLAERRRRAELRRTMQHVQEQQEALHRAAEGIVATSSSRTIAGFLVQRQIEAVFADGHVSPTKAVEALKALAAQKGANAIINLHSERLPSGKCQAQGDAVIVRPIGKPPASGPAPTK